MQAQDHVFAMAVDKDQRLYEGYIKIHVSG
jgi:hypothetical protein